MLPGLAPIFPRVIQRGSKPVTSVSSLNWGSVKLSSEAEFVELRPLKDQISFIPHRADTFRQEISRGPESQACKGIPS